MRGIILYTLLFWVPAGGRRWIFPDTPVPYPTLLYIFPSLYRMKYAVFTRGSGAGHLYQGRVLFEAKPLLIYLLP